MSNPVKDFEYALAVQRVASHPEDNTDVDGINVAITPRLTAEIEKTIRGAGKLLEVVAYAEAKGGGWAATLDTEYAALKLFYAWRRSDTHLTKKGNTWVVSKK